MIFWKKFLAVAAMAMIATGLFGFAIGQWASADGPLKNPSTSNGTTKTSTVVLPSAHVDLDAPVTPTIVRREAVIRMPVGTFVKEVDLPPYGSGRIVWTYEGDRVHGQLSFNAMGAEVECTTEAEISMASTGTIYGVLTGFKITNIKLPAELKTGMAGIDVAKAWPLIEPIVNELIIDLPFSYSFRMSGNNLVLQHYRILLAGPNPLGKLGGVVAGHNQDVFAVLSYFQAISTAIEGSYTLTDRDSDAPKKKSMLPKPTASSTK